MIKYYLDNGKKKMTCDHCWHAVSPYGTCCKCGKNKKEIEK